MVGNNIYQLISYAENTRAKLLNSDKVCFTSWISIWMHNLVFLTLFTRLITVWGFSILSLGLWHKLFSLAHMDWVPPRSIGDMLIISFRGLGNSLRGKTLWQIACLTIIWIVWHERNVRTFEEASCSVAFKEVPLNFFN